MKAYFDTSVLVAVVVDQLPQHERALDVFANFCESKHEAFCSTHCLAECYSTLTALPLARRIQPHEAWQIIEETFTRNLTVLALNRTLYLKTLKRASQLGLRSGVIYDALHLACAEHSKCDQLYTFNLRDFKKLNPESLSLVSP